MLRTVNRAGRVLDLFTAEQPQWGASSVGRELGIAKSQAHELLVSLAEIGLLQRVYRGRYELGWRSVTLGSLVLATSELRTDAARVMRSLAARYGNTVELAVWGLGGPLCIATCEGRHVDAVPPSRVGAGVPAHCTAAGKVLLASRPWEEVGEPLARDGLPPMTDRTIVTADELRDELARVRGRGFAFEREEHAPGTYGVAAPIACPYGEVLAAVSMSVPAHRWRSAHGDYTRALVAAASYTSSLVCRRLVRHDAELTEGRVVRDVAAFADSPSGSR